MARRSKIIQKILWAVDPFEEKGPVRQKTVEALKSLADRTGAQVELVHVFSPAELDLATDFGASWADNYQPATEAALNQVLRECGIPNAKSSKVLVQGSTSLRASVDMLVQYAQANHFDLVTVGRHAKTGMARLLLGSFTETLILHSQIPVLALGATDVREDFSSILFPTDLGENSRSMFEYVASLGAQLQARVTILHSMPNPVEPFVQSGIYLLGGGWVPVHEFMASDREAREKKLKALCSWAQKRGVEVDYEFTERDQNVTTAILDAAERRKSSLIVMAAQSGAITTAILGSVSRQVVRHAHCPVWVIHAPLVRAQQDVSAA